MRILLRGLRCWQWYWSRIMSCGIRRRVDWYMVISVVEELVVSVVRVVSERADSELLLHADNYSPIDMASYPRRRESSKIYSSYICVCVCLCFVASSAQVILFPHVRTQGNASHWLLHLLPWCCGECKHYETWHNSLMCKLLAIQRRGLHYKN